MNLAIDFSIKTLLDRFLLLSVLLTCIIRETMYEQIVEAHWVQERG